MSDTPLASSDPVPEALLRWARREGLVADARQERRLAAMRLEVLAGRALPDGGAAEVLLTAQWAVFICWVDDRIDRHGLGSVAGELEAFTAPLRRVLGSEAGPFPQAGGVHTAALAGLWGRTATGMPAGWRARFTADYTDFLDASEQEATLRRLGVRLPLADYIDLRRRTITLLPLLDVLEATGHALLPQDPRIDARVADLREALADIAGWVNDLASGGEDEAARQDNLVTAIARQHRCPVPKARAQAAAMVEDRQSGFRSTARLLRTTRGLTPEQAHRLHRYVDLVERFLSATVHWLAGTGRFTSDLHRATPQR
ncbi:terpene synthase family protein [Kitasatospora sp. NPDC091257]|uniref:terpene synthase family protein n=1 Tax=Kitasatospora sp. NPDC091257 TaxID=3364084 RepID=UPI003807A108